MIPAPNMKDVFMDLQADSEQFLHGKAHKGMAQGAKNILVKFLFEIFFINTNLIAFNFLVVRSKYDNPKILFN